MWPDKWSLFMFALTLALIGVMAWAIESAK
jgi:hypothetical protein